jgi:acyl-CoA thioesterase FadM
MVTAMMSLETRQAVPLPDELRAKLDAYRRRAGAE